jgi:hypothetical protein
MARRGTREREEKWRRGLGSSCLPLADENSWRWRDAGEALGDGAGSGREARRVKRAASEEKGFISTPSAIKK